MALFNLAVDRKVTVWTREFHEVEAETLQAAVKTLSDACEVNPTNGSADLESFNGEYETLYDTEELMSLDDNDGSPTVEVVDMSDAAFTLWSNKQHE